MDIIKNGKIDIDENTWLALNQKYTKEEIKNIIHDTIEDNNLDIPLREITFEDAQNDFIKLQEHDDNSLISETEWFTRYDYKYTNTYNDEYKIIRANNVGNKTADYYHQYNRWLCDSINSPSPYRSWHIRKFRDGMLNALWSLKHTKVNDATFRTAISLRKYMASQFRCSAAKSIYNFFEAKSTLDLSSGWGDRLMGFAASNCQKYIGFDPNNNLQDGYKNQILDYCSEKEAKVICSGSEYLNDHLTEDDMFDLIFTSPPYFNIEKYTKDDTQSYKRYNKIGIWLSEFLFKTLSQAWEHLEDNGILAINISDVYSNHTINKICDPMNDFISTLPNAVFKGAIGYEMRKRPNSGALKDKTGLFAEPIWIWQKQKIASR